VAGPVLLIDTHCHLDFDSYAGDLLAVLTRAAEAGVIAIVNPGTDLDRSATACDLAAAHAPIFAAVGIHPNSTADFSPEQLAVVRALAAREKVVAVGEIGLDYYRERSPKAVQRRAFEAQLALAGELSLPVIVHNRQADDDVLALLETWVGGLNNGPLKERPGVLHSFSAPFHVAERALASGFYIGVTGPVTYKKADELRHIVARLPVDRLLIETDGPFLAPHPHRGERNEPAYVRHIADRIAALRLIDLETVAAQTTANARRLFGLPQNG